MFPDDASEREPESCLASQGLVTLINPNKIFPAITPYALDILTTSLEENGFEVPAEVMAAIRNLTAASNKVAATLN